MITVYLDFESYFDKDYSLKNMSTIEYVLDPRWETLGCSVAVEDEEAQYLSHDEFEEWLKTINWSDALMVAHNNIFDGTVLTQRYNTYPAKYACTQAEARAILPVDSTSLARVSKALGIGEKGNALKAGSHEVTKDLADYANNDLELCRRIHKLLYPFIPERERELISLTIRLAVEPSIELDKALLEESLQQEVETRQRVIRSSGVDEQVLTSNLQFAKLLRGMGLTPPTKISPATGEETEAFAKGDAEFQAFMAEYPEYKHIFEARLAAKSNIKIRRAERLLRIANLPSRLPVPLRYFGAHTGRWSGTDGINLQNLPQQHRSPLRRALRAPKGYLIGAGDSAQIELRTNLWFSGQLDKLDILRNGGDIYKADASDFFGIAEDEVSSMQRQFGKVRQLGLGFGMGHQKFRYYCASGPLGMDPIKLSVADAYMAVHGYRAAHDRVVQSWKMMGELIPVMTLESAEVCHGPIRVIHEAIELPNGMSLLYPGLQAVENGGWEYGVDKKVKYLYPSYLQQNVVQALARIIVSDQMLEIDTWLQGQDPQARVVGMTHDEVIFIAPEWLAEETERKVLEIMSTAPSWAETLPLSAEVKLAEYYSK